jgi:hypothetical protein
MSYLEYTQSIQEQTARQPKLGMESLRLKNSRKRQLQISYNTKTLPITIYGPRELVERRLQTEIRL